MTYNDFILETKKLLEYNTLLWKQTHIMFIPITNKSIRENPVGEETRVRYDIDNLWQEFVFKENKILLFINKYLTFFVNGLNIYSDLFYENNISIPSNEVIEESIFYFDAFISSFYTLIEPQQRNVFCDWFGKENINNFYPSRNEVGLFWQIYMLRNRIIHFTSGKYANTSNECIRYQEFSSNVKMLNINNEGKINANCTLIDINKCEQARNAVSIAIKNKQINPFDLLFPYESAKGYGKKKPFISHIGNDIFFDHIDSGVKLIKDIHRVLNNLNNLFLEKFLDGDVNIETTLNSKTEILFNNEKLSYSLYDVFYKENCKEDT